MPTYASVAEIREEMAAGVDSNATDDKKVLNLARRATARLDKLLYATTKLPFFPQIAQRAFPISADFISSHNNTLWFQQPLLSISALVANTTTLVVGTDVELWPTLKSPADTIRLKSWDNNWYKYLPTDGSPGFVTITGTWGVHSQYATAWLAVDVLSLPSPATQIDATTTVITVADADGSDAYGNEPRFSPGQLIKIDSEYMDVVTVDSSSNELTVIRGVLGSTAATHDTGATISVWQVEEPVRRLVARQTAFMYARRGAYESSTMNDFGVVNFPSDQLAEVRGILQGYAYGSY